jgi:GNAT superfamily N-acetyltransferase
MLWRLAIFRRDHLVIYSYSPRQGEGVFDPRVRASTEFSKVPPAVRDTLRREAGRWGLWSARYRIVRGATLLYVTEQGRLLAYGWIQKWDPLPRRLRWLAPSGTILGYFWTAPENRGQGLYGRLLKHCLAICEDRHSVAVIVYAEAWNKRSLRGLEKVGFVRLGEYEITSALFGLICSRRVISEERTLAEAAAGS